MTAQDHPLRAALSAEMHVRRMPRLAAPCRLMQVVTLLDEATIGAAHAHVAALAHGTDAIVAPSAKYAVLAIDGMTLVWERHTEFATYTLLGGAMGDDLSRRAAWTSALLRTRIDIALARQNRDLLASMDRRTHLQLRLQQTVEGLSVVAISYYLVGLVGYLLNAVHGVRHEIAMAIAVPVVVVAVAFALRRVRRHGSGEPNS